MTSPIQVEISIPWQQYLIIVAKLGLVAVSQQGHQKIVLQVTLVIQNQYSSQVEEALIAAHRKEIEDTMEIVREVSYYMFFYRLY